MDVGEGVRVTLCVGGGGGFSSDEGEVRLCSDELQGVPIKASSGTSLTLYQVNGTCKPRSHTHKHQAVNFPGQCQTFDRN